MDTQRSQRVMALFKEACQIDPQARAAFVADRCRDDSEMGRRLNAMLAQDERGFGPIDGAAAGAGLLADELARRGSQARIEGVIEPASFPVLAGQYRIVRVIGEGGMGTVYEAEQAIPRRTVALKAIRRGDASRMLLRRLEYEAHVLGRLQHPGIAHIYEAGAADPDNPDEAWFAMEYVDGRPLTEYAETHRLDVRGRLELMIRVCDAVQHAHQRGVIHRDLKPANILVAEGDEEWIKGSRDQGTEEIGAGRTSPSVPVPKVLDFGVARLVGDDTQLTTMHTLSGQLVGTLPYMSPEQVAGDPDQIDTRSDIYALGVLLYELLSGRQPHSLGGLALPEAARVIREVEPPRLRSVHPELSGELEIIVAKAMDKDRERRYASASQLGDDIQRFLDGDPIEARPHSSFYMLRKAMHRHRRAVGAAAVFMTLVVVFGVVSFYQARQNRRLADRETAARRLADEKALELDTSLYFSRIGYAQAAYHNGDLGRMKSLLAACPEESRGWEWFFLNRLSDRSRASRVDRALPGLGGARIDARGRLMLTWDAVHLRLRDAESFEVLSELEDLQGIHIVSLDS